VPSTAIIWGVIAKIANKMAALSTLFNSLYHSLKWVHYRQFVVHTNASIMPLCYCNGLQATKE